MKPIVPAEDFHPMLGHVEVGVRVQMPCGQILTIKSAMIGWNLVDDEGREVLPKAIASGYALMDQILVMAEESRSKAGTTA